MIRCLYEHTQSATVCEWSCTWYVLSMWWCVMTVLYGHYTMSCERTSVQQTLPKNRGIRAMLQVSYNVLFSSTVQHRSTENTPFTIKIKPNNERISTIHALSSPSVYHHSSTSRYHTTIPQYSVEGSTWFNVLVSTVLVSTVVHNCRWQALLIAKMKVRGAGLALLTKLAPGIRLGGLDEKMRLHNSPCTQKDHTEKSVHQYRWYYFQREQSPTELMYY